VVVKDKITSAPLGNVCVKKIGNNPCILTDHQGKGVLANFARHDSLVFELYGYKSFKTEFQKLSDNGFVVNLEEEVMSLDEIILSATRFEEKMKDVAQQVEVINSKSIEFMNQPTSADLLQNNGNVLVQKSQAGGGSPVIRGFEANKVLIVVDGVRMNNAIYRGGHLQNVISIDNSMLEKAEIAYGPGSVAYGSDALGGVMHFFTRMPELSDSAKVYFKGNSFARYATANNGKSLHADFNIGLKKIAFLSGVTFSDFGDLRQGNGRRKEYPDFGKRFLYSDRINGKDSMVTNKDVNVQKGSGYEQMDFIQKILFKQNSDVSHIVNVQYSTSSDIPRYDRLVLLNGAFPKFAEWYYGPQKRFFSSYTLSLTKKGKLYDQANTVAGFQQIEESRYDRQFRKAGLNSRIEKVQVYSLNSDFVKNIRKNELRYGIELNHNDVASTAFKENINTGEKTALDTRYPDGGSSMNTASVYYTHALELTPKLILNDGLRFSYVDLYSSFKDSTFFPFPFQSIHQKNKALNGNLGLIYNPYKNWWGRLLFSSGFRAPNVDDLAKVFESVPGRVVVPNPNLKPEYIYNFEGGISHKLFSKIHLELTGYYTIYRDVIGLTLAQFEGNDSIVYNDELSAVQTSVNSGRAYIYGGNGNVVAEIGKYFLFSSSLNYTFGRIRTDSVDYPLDHIPPFYGKASVLMKMKKVRAEFFVLWNGWKRKTDYNMIGEDNFSQATPDGMPSWYTLNIRGQYFISKNFSLQLSAENLLDRNYRVFGSGISAPGRNFQMTLRAGF
jgi:hemoglobin/transferrin/lactoferrin receptor protein